jgi:uncharacterized iron-regulated membrane protein
MIRGFCVFLHRWLGLTTAAFLIVVGLSGSILAFLPELDRWITPQFHLGSISSGAELGAAELVGRAEALAPGARATSVELGNGDAATVRMQPRPDAGPANFNQMFLHPITGEELGRRLAGPLPDRLDALLPFIYRLHYSLALGSLGSWTLGLVALSWTLDCFIAFFLTLPASASTRSSQKSWLRRWKPAWLIKWRSSFYRVNFDLHRASGLWLWAALLIFAWSSVYMDLNGVYTAATRALLPLEQSYWFRANDSASDDEPMDWVAAQSVAERIAADAAREHGFTIDRAVYLGLDRSNHLFEYRIHSSRDIGEKSGQTFFWFDASTGALLSMILPTGHRAGNTLTTWLVELHEANVFGLPYKIFVCVLGVAIAALSVTGVYIWWRKRATRESGAAGTWIR